MEPIHIHTYIHLWGFPDGSEVKNLPDMQETQVRSLGQEDPLERRKWQPTPVVLSGKFNGQRSLLGYISVGVTKSGA